MSDNERLAQEPAIVSALRLLTSRPEDGGTRHQIDKWVSNQEDPELVLLAMVTKSEKVRRHVFVRLTGLRANPDHGFGSKTWESFFLGWVGETNVLGTRQQPKQLSVIQALDALATFRAWKEVWRLASSTASGHSLVRKRMPPARIFRVFRAESLHRAS